MSKRFLIVIATVLAFAVACGGDDADGANPADESPGVEGVEVLIEFEDGEPVRDVWRQDIPLGDTVSVVVVGARDEQVHIHGYDLYIEPSEDDDAFEFDALIPGRFEIELEQSGRLLLEITVS